MPKVWETISAFKSLDLVTRLYKGKHGGGLSAGKANEIVSHFIQGNEYFANAANAADVVRSLLPYYGVLSFSKDMILFLDPKDREIELNPSHGLEAIN